MTAEIITVEQDLGHYNYYYYYYYYSSTAFSWALAAFQFLDVTHNW
jgi:hypothetical protein